MFTKNNPEIGARPGTLAIPENSPEPRIRVTQYSADDVEVFDIDDVATLPGLVKSDYVTWVDIQGFGNEAKLKGIAAAFDLHPIALEHAVNVPQRAKAESYEGHNLIIARAPLLEDDENLSVPQVCFIVGEGFLITFQERYLGFFDEVRERIKGEEDNSGNTARTTLPTRSLTPWSTAITRSRSSCRMRSKILRTGLWRIRTPTF